MISVISYESADFRAEILPETGRKATYFYNRISAIENPSEAP
jgi:hypothetical protein